MTSSSPPPPSPNPSSFQFRYFGSFPFNDNFVFGDEARDGNSRRSAEIAHRTIEEQLIDRAEMAELNGEFLLPNIDNDDPLQSPSDVILLQLSSNGLQMLRPDCPIPFHRLPLHKIKHIVAFEGDDRAKNVLLVENFAFSDHQRGPISRCHQFQNPSGEEVDQFCMDLQRKFDEIEQKVVVIDQQNVRN